MAPLSADGGVVVHRVSVARLGGARQALNHPNELPKVAGPLHLLLFVFDDPGSGLTASETTPGFTQLVAVAIGFQNVNPKCSWLEESEQRERCDESVSFRKVAPGAGSHTGVGIEPVPANLRTKPDVGAILVVHTESQFMPDSWAGRGPYSRAVGIVKPLVLNTDEPLVVDFVCQTVDDTVEIIVAFLSLPIIPSSFAVKDLRHLLCVRRLARIADFNGERGRENGVWPKRLGRTITAFCFTRYGQPEFLFSADATP
jgi:hypothetical protein